MKKLIIIFLLLCTPAFAQTDTVERVIDGDTIKKQMHAKGEISKLAKVTTQSRRQNIKFISNMFSHVSFTL